MSGAGVRVGVGTRFAYDGEVVEVVEMLATAAGNEVVLAGGAGRRVRRVAVKQLLASDRARVIPDGPGPSADDSMDVAGVVLAELTEPEQQRVVERAAHVREALTGYRSGSAELAGDGEPRPQFDPGLPLERRYASKAAELRVGVRTLKRWVGDFRRHGEAGLVSAKAAAGVGGGLGRVDERWVQTALEVMVEHTGQSTPSRSMVIDRAGARLAARYGPGVVRLPSRATAYRALEELERRHPTFRLSSKRNQDIAARPGQPYGKLRPTRAGEYLLMDTTRLDVFGMDPLTLRWVQVELTVAMDWYTRCITGIRLTPVSTKSVDAAATLYQAYRPPPAGPGWPAQAVWPEHGIPRAVLLDAQAVDGPLRGAAGPALVPETIVVDHGKIYVSEHLTSVCQRLGISIQPARLRTGRDKGPVERFFRTLREDLLQALPGYKGPDVYSRGERPEAEAFFFLDELDAVIREWVGVVYHHRPHASLLDPHLPGLRMSPAVMFEHGMARAGWIEVPRDPDLAFEFLPTCWRTIQHYGVEVGGRRYNGPALDAYRDSASPHGGPAKGRWPIQVNPDDITKVYFRDPGNTGMKEFNRALLEFFGHPGRRTGTTAQFAQRALDCVLSCEVRLAVVDDLHFLRWRQANGAEVSNHFKYIANEFPVTLVFIGVGLEQRGLFSEGESYADAVLAQTGRRTTRLGMDPFTVATRQARRQWRTLLLAVEQRLVLAEKQPGMLADELADYLFARSTGHIGSLMTLVNRGCQRAVRTGTERLSRDLLDRVKNDAAAEAARRELETALAAGRITTRTTPAKPTADRPAKAG